MKTCLFLGLSVLAITLNSCYSNKYNQWTEKDCAYVDYYQNRPLNTPDNNYYQSKPVR